VIEGDGDWVDQYIRRAGALAPVGRVEAAQLATLAQSENGVAEQALFERNLRIVVSLAKRYGRHDSLERLFRLGETGLRAAINRFEPSKGLSISTYATWWVKQAMVDGGGHGDCRGGVREPRQPLPSAGGASAMSRR
jgi:DNA-directed RNA polymerase sigma subunit (sigma70/sigma32)